MKFTKDEIKELSTEIGIKAVILLLVMGIVLFIGMRVVDYSIKSKVQKIESLKHSFNQGNDLFCKDTVVSINNGWVLDAQLLRKGDKYYYIEDCFTRK